jgi:glucokinase
MPETAGAVALGFDIGGTKLASIAVYQNGEILERLTTPTIAHEGGKAVLSRLCQLARDLKVKMTSQVVGIGVATHGVVMSETGIVRFASSKLPGWTGTNLKDSLLTVFPKTPVMVANDGHTAALAEYLFGSGQGSRDFVMLVLGTGVGGGVISNGELLQGANGAAGRLGHLSIDPEGPQCSCGNRGCLELYVSGTAIGQAAMHDAELSADLSSSVGNELTAQDVVNAAKNGHPLAQNLLRDSGRKLGFAILQIARTFDPKIIAIGGGMISAGDLLLEPARTLVRAGTPPELSPPRLEWAQLGADASLLGAAMLGWNATRSGSTPLDFESASTESC